MPAGFTLVELIVSVAAASILLAIAIPGFSTTLLNNRRAAAANDFIGALSYARSTAVSRRLPVTMCHSASPTATPPSCSTSGGWQEGWFIFVDQDSDGVFDSGDTPPDELLRVHEALPPGITLKGQTAVANRVSFTAAGQATASYSGNLALCDSRGWTGDARVVLLGSGGRARVISKADDSSLSSCTP
jgi:type IV fimbrial biogenesis protein FimT